MQFELLGVFAGILTTSAFLPQVVQLVKTRSVEGISVLMYSVYCLGLLLWMIYGFYLSSIPIMVFNSITFLLVLAILVMKLLWKNKKLCSTMSGPT